MSDQAATASPSSGPLDQPRRIGRLIDLKRALVVAFVAVIASMGTGTALAHDLGGTNLPDHIVDGNCASSGGAYAVLASEWDIEPDYHAGRWFNGLQYEQWVGFQIQVAYRDLAGSWRYINGNTVAGPNGNFAAGFAKVYLNGSWKETTIDIGDFLFWSNTSGKSPLSVAKGVPGPGTYWVRAKITWYPLNIVDSAHNVIRSVSDTYAHWTDWTRVVCYEGDSYLESLNNYGYFEIR